MSPQNVLLTHFFHGRGSELQKSTLGLFRSLAHQLLDKLPTCCKEIMRKHQALTRQSSEKSGKSEEPPITWQQEWLHTFLEKHLLQVAAAHPIIIFIDALDECEHEARHNLADFFAEIVRDTLGASLKIFVSCRHYPNLFSEGSRIQTTANNMEDIAVFVESKLQVIDQVKRSLLASEIINNARGNFQWAKIVTIESVKLHRKGRTAAEIRENIRRLPKDIHELYDSLFKDADPDDLRLAHRLFHWLCFAKRPLCVRELQYVIMLSPDTKERSIGEICHRTDFREELIDMANTIIDISRGLAEILISEDLTGGVWMNLDATLPDLSREASPRDEMNLHLSWTSKVQLIHQTVMDYVVDTGLQTVQGDRPEFSRGQSNYFITRSCLRYITMDDFCDQKPHSHSTPTTIQRSRVGDMYPPSATRTQRSHVRPHQAPPPTMSTDRVDTATDRNALREYIQEFLESHILDADAEGIDQSDFIVRLGWPNKLRLRNFAIALGKPYFIEEFAGTSFPRTVVTYDSLLHWSVHIGITGIVKSIAQRDFSQFLTGDFPGHSFSIVPPLDTSAWEGQSMFINGYYNVNLPNSSGEPALFRAISKLQASAFQELMKSPVVDPNIRNTGGETPLHHVNWRSTHTFSPMELRLAPTRWKSARHLSFDCEKLRPMVKQLLDHPRVNTSLQDYEGKTALLCAVDSHDPEIFKMNVDAAKDFVNIKDNFGNTPLSEATIRGNVAAVQELIRCGRHVRETLHCAFEEAQLHAENETGGEKERLGLCMSFILKTLIELDGQILKEVSHPFLSRSCARLAFNRVHNHLRQKCIDTQH